MSFRWMYKTDNIPWRTIRTDSGPAQAMALRLREAVQDPDKCVVTYIEDDGYKVGYMRSAYITAEMAEATECRMTFGSPSIYNVEYILHPKAHIDRYTLSKTWEERHYDDLKRLEGMEKIVKGRDKIHHTTEMFKQIISGLMGKGIAEIDQQYEQYGRQWTARLRFDDMDVTIKTKREE